MYYYYYRLKVVFVWGRRREKRNTTVANLTKPRASPSQTPVAGRPAAAVFICCSHA